MKIFTKTSIIMENLLFKETIEPTKNSSCVCCVESNKNFKEITKKLYHVC